MIASFGRRVLTAGLAYPLGRRSVAGAATLALVTMAVLARSPDTARAWIDATIADPVAFGFVIVVLYLVRPLLAWPTMAISMVVGYGYGVWLGIPVALTGAVATALPVFFTVRWLARETLGTPPVEGQGAFDRLHRTTRRYFDGAGSVRGVTAAKLAPIPADVVTGAAAASGVGPRPFVLGTAIGETPWTVAAVVVGASAATITTSGLGGLSAPLAIGCTLASALLLVGPAYRYTQRSVRESPGESTTD